MSPSYPASLPERQQPGEKQGQSSLNVPLFALRLFQRRSVPDLEDQWPGTGFALLPAVMVRSPLHAELH